MVFGWMWLSPLTSMRVRDTLRPEHYENHLFCATMRTRGTTCSLVVALFVFQDLKIVRKQFQQFS